MTASNVVSFTMGGAIEQQVLGPNPRRKALLFLAPSASIAYLRPDSMGNVAGGIPVPTGSAPVQLTLAMHGDIIKGPWFGFCAAGATLGIVETLD